jgi:hypothetical protein
MANMLEVGGYWDLAAAPLMEVSRPARGQLQKQQELVQPPTVRNLQAGIATDCYSTRLQGGASGTRGAHVACVPQSCAAAKVHASLLVMCCSNILLC